MDDLKKKRRILVVEDSVDRQVILERIYGTHDLVVVDNVADAKSRLAAEQFDLVSLDHDLGIGGRGVEVALLLTSPRHSTTDVIVHSMNPDGIRAIKTLLPDVIELSVSLLDRGTVWHGRLRSELASEGDINWGYVLMGSRHESD